MTENSRAFAQERTNATFRVKQYPQEHPTAAMILEDISSANSTADYFREEIQKRHNKFEDESKLHNQSNEEKKLIKRYQHYLEHVKSQQDKIMQTRSYKPTQKEVEAVAVDGQDEDQPGHQILHRNRKVNEQNIVGQTMYTLHILPKVYSYKELLDQ